MPEPLLILGASVRAAAQSAAAAGFAVRAVDLFGDQDLSASAAAVRVTAKNSYPHGLADEAGEFPPSSWMYTGGLENYPELVGRISDRHTLLGNSAAVLRAVRDPQRVAAVLQAAGLDGLPVTLSRAEIPPAETWLEKALHSSGGERVRYASALAAGDAITPVSDGAISRAPSQYYQRYQPGLAVSAVFVAAGCRAALVGVSEQLLGKAWGAPAPFMYAGSIGPLALAAALQEKIERLGNVLAEQFGLVGIFGIDGVLADGSFWPVEINPRYVASAEIYERAYGASLVAQHVAACTRGVLASGPAPNTERIWGKAIVYAPHAGSLPADAFETFQRNLAQQPGGACADLPLPDTHFRAGEPVCTVLISGASTADVRRQLQELLSRVPLEAT